MKPFAPLTERLAPAVLHALTWFGAATALLLGIVPPAVAATLPVACPSRLLLGTACLSCGMTRALMHAMRGEFGAAMMFNELVAVVLPVAAAAWVVFAMASVRILVRKGAGRRRHE